MAGRATACGFSRSTAVAGRCCLVLLLVTASFAYCMGLGLDSEGGGGGGRGGLVLVFVLMAIDLLVSFFGCLGTARMSGGCA